LTNRTARDLAVERVVTSCPCVGVAPSAVRVGPHESQQLELWCEPAAEPDFMGRLAVEVVGYLPGGEPAFRTICKFEVHDGS
jgi:hypothetical protein